ncbi:uncharacterized protein LOC114971230 [Acropora millepora]|uniref:uncharacterized protein LOC114971230 n=1 Tax=Acropora millepora TaxID=45264 RepID=UPI001CF0F871|nr:uncharacterized protein LOC114971230 [Acropora millepora]
MFPFGRHSNPALDTASELAILDADFTPRAAFFAVFVPRKTCLHCDTNLRLWCSPTSKRCELIAYEEALGNILIGDGISDRPMCSNEKAYIFLSEGIVTPLIPGRLQRLHVSLQEELVLKKLKVRVVNRGVLTISFCGSKERDEDNMLCEVDVTLPPSTNERH